MQPARRPALHFRGASGPCPRLLFLRNHWALTPNSSTPSSGPMTRPASDNASDIHSSGLKATWPRIRILRLFQEATQHHLSAEDVYRTLLADGEEIGLATIYRVLTQFEQARLLSRLHFESGKAVYELNEGHHHDHLVCVLCGRVEEFCDPEIERLQHLVAERRGFQLRDHALSLYGVCSDPACRARHGKREIDD